MNNVGSRIKKIREEKGITQEFMAYELDISQSNYGRLEKDDRRLNIPKIQKIAEVLDISIASLIEEKSGVKDENNEILIQKDIIIQRDKEHIASLKEEIIFLRKLLDNIVV